MLKETFRSAYLSEPGYEKETFLRGPRIRLRLLNPHGSLPELDGNALPQRPLLLWIRCLTVLHPPRHLLDVVELPEER